ncbi:hypothetical protein FB451DRAFT_1167900 [Mycena latifolia]|nr:hypothetical protein FB451DRAFT_1167900 [Mycena latifolia]
MSRRLDRNSGFCFFCLTFTNSFLRRGVSESDLHMTRVLQVSETLIDPSVLVKHATVLLRRSSPRAGEILRSNCVRLPSEFDTVSILAEAQVSVRVFAFVGRVNRQPSLLPNKSPNQVTFSDLAGRNAAGEAADSEFELDYRQPAYTVRTLLHQLGIPNAPAHAVALSALIQHQILTASLWLLETSQLF